MLHDPARLGDKFAIRLYDHREHPAAEVDRGVAGARRRQVARIGDGSG
jgi:hypothetical protein